MPPTLLALRTSVARDIRDPNFRTFTAPYVDDLINAGIEEVGRLYPNEALVTLTPVLGSHVYPVPTMQTVFRVEIWKAGKSGGLLPESDAGEPGSGWEHFAGSLHFPQPTNDTLIGSTVVAWGYANRVQLAADADVSDLDSTAEWGVRRYARSQAFTAMNNDRALFKQWQGQTQNTDVSPNMLNQMVTLYQSEWDRQRNYLRRLRRV